MQWLKQSTAANIQLGPFLDEDDGKTAETGLTIAQADIRLSKNGGDIAQSNNATGATHDELGYYTVPLDTTDTGTLGRLLVAVHESGALPVWREFMVVRADMWDGFCSTDYLQVDVIQVESADATDTIRDAIVDDATRIDASSVNAVEGKLDTVDAIVDTILVDTNELQGDWTNTGRLDTIIDSILADTGELQADDYPTSIAAIKAETALIVADTNELQTDDIPSTLSTMDGKLDTIDGIVDNIVADTNELQTDDYPTSIAAVKAETALIVADTNELQTDWADGGRLDNILDAASAPSAATVADAVWDEALADHDTEDTLGNVINDLTEEAAGTYRFTSGALAQAPTGGAGGSGAITFVYTLTSSVDSAPVPDASVWACTDQAGTTVVASGTTDVNGQVTFYLDAATYYFFRQKAGWNFSNPDTETVA